MNSLSSHPWRISTGVAAAIIPTSTLLLPNTLIATDSYRVHCNIGASNTLRKTTIDVASSAKVRSSLTPRRKTPFDIFVDAKRASMDVNQYQNRNEIMDVIYAHKPCGLVADRLHPGNPTALNASTCWRGLQVGAHCKRGAPRVYIRQLQSMQYNAVIDCSSSRKIDSMHVASI